MPRTPRNSPNPPGRPAKRAQAEKALQIAAKSGESIAEAAKRAGVSPATVHAHKARKGAAKGASSPASPAPVALPQGGPAVSMRPDLLELLRRIGQARNAAAWAEVEEGLTVHTRGGEEALAPWLARPVVAVDVGVDELEALSGALDLAVELAARAEPGGPALRALREVSSLGKSVATVKARRPQEPKPDAVAEAVRAAAGESVEHLLRHHAAVEQEWTELLGDLRPFLGRAAPPLRQRLDALLEGA